MTLDAATLIRAASGVVFLGVGLILAWVTRRSAERVANLGMATVCVGLGTANVAINIAIVDASTAFIGAFVGAACWVVGTAGAVVYLASPSVRGRLRPWDGIAAAPLLLGVSSMLVPGNGTLLFAAVGVRLPNLEAVDSALRAYSTASFAFAGAVVLIAISSARAAGGSSSKRAARGHALLTVGLLFISVFLSGALSIISIKFPALVLLAAGHLGLTLMAVIAWIPRGRWTAWSLLAIVLLGEVTSVAGSYLLAVGILRIVAAALVVVAMLRYGLAGADVHLPTARRGTLAAVALAALFIVAQIAQNFLSAEYGLIMGGIVAGVFLFAASPIQRAMERVGERRREGAAITVRPADADARENAYREAVRLALRDRVLTREEDRHILRLAHHLGISSPRAMEIQDEVQKERKA